ncbi:hypothetical protein JZ751_014830 [Albula glossodonta]|uniref:Ras association domain-containing protein n=1 Tax=Albula glossodonta TaxID=121402 RepID=A0A8T2N2Q6_9TELE|nr:hypothetical protein JZ751_014830 [Albula glossodonta]
MELKVSVEGVQRIVCGVTDKTTCQEVVIALAQALGRTGRYTLKEKFKEFERNVTPDERLLESLAKYGQQSREVQLMLLHNGPSHGAAGVDELMGGSQQACAQLRRPDVATRVRRGSGSCGIHRQSLPPLSRLRLHKEPPQIAEAKKPKRKSLTLVEEAFGWLENLSRSGKPQRGREREKSKEVEKRKGSTFSCQKTPDSSQAVSEDCCSPGCMQGTGCHRKTAVSMHQKRSSILDEPGHSKAPDMERDGVNNDNGEKDANKKADIKKDHELNAGKDKAEGKLDPYSKRYKSTSSPPTPKTEEEKLQILLMHQQVCLHELQLQQDSTDIQIQKLEERQKAWQKQEVPSQLTEEEEEAEELEYWENELRAEEGYERDLQEQFLEMKKKAAECKAKLEEYKRRMQGLDPAKGRISPEAEPLTHKGQDSSTGTLKPVAHPWTNPHTSTLCAAAPQDGELQQSSPLTQNSTKGQMSPNAAVASHHPHVQIHRSEGLVSTGNSGHIGLMPKLTLEQDQHHQLFTVQK